ncbi:hypothetical protein HNQ07_000641 [Deinococcus metalli]|uniref:DUF4139 domain-containing protein n=1 Tax=Deinococcus metalli TaxID=1141878 RepID=A0A7W8KBM3_9DEIO|nr:DUF4139 domain-containing protein [Deinococcus metalli]MBB5375197.1 hypothetical protein [Deinococcus metalli]GHF31039.1 hypothetical protein GCM10017781_04000 [Deinococcus metalli]
MKKRTLLAAALLASPALAADLRIYPSFAEVRQPVTSTGTRLDVTLPQAAWENVLAGSLDLEGLPFDAATQTLQANWLSGLEGQTVYLRRGDTTEPVTLVRARDLLVKDAQGRYFNVRFEELQFSAPPPLNPQSPSQTLTYTLPKAGSGTLTYLTRAVTWAPRYTLKASDAGAQLGALADLRNTTELAYDVKATELYAGDVTVQANPQAEAANFAADSAVMRAVPAPSAPATKIQSQGELRGLTRYDLTTPFTLPANSVITLPFLTPKLTKFERYVGLTTYFNPGPQEGTLNRSYRLEADQRLPAGPLTVREDGRLVGQAQLPDTREGGTIDFTLGDDPDVEYTRSVQLVRQDKDTKGNVTRSTYKVTYAFESSKDRAVRAEITERIGGRIIIIDAMTPVQNQGVATLKVDLPAKAKLSRSFTVVIANN